MAKQAFRTQHHSRSLVHVFCALLLSLTTAAAFAQSQSGFTYNGNVYVSYQAGEYLQTPAGPQGAAAMRATGANYGSVVVTQYEQTYTANTIAPETASTAGYNSSSDPLSPTDAAVVAAIQNLQAQGLTVFLKPQVDSLDGTYRGDFAPTNPSAWFASYQTFILHYAQLASENGVGGLVIGTELASLTGPGYQTDWDNIIAQIRAAYPSLTLAYGANATSATDEFTTVSFWDKVDIIGVDGYFPLTDHADPTVAELVAAWTSNKNGLNIVAALKTLQSTYNKPLIFTELGYVSATGTNEAPYSSAAAGAAYDPTEQANCYEAFFEVFSQQSSWMKGVFWWAWTVSPPGMMDIGYTPQNKPASTIVLPEWFGSTTQSFTLAPSNSILTVQAGANAPDTIAVTNLGGFTGAVALAVQGLPSGVSAGFAAGAAAGTQVLTFTADSSAVAGTATVTVTGISGALTSSTTIALTVQPAPVSQTITFATPAGQAVGTPLTLAATATSSLPVTFTSTTPNVCTVSGAVASFYTAGTCTIDANQAGNSAYLAAPQVEDSFPVSGSPSFTIAAANQSLSVTQGQQTSDGIIISSANGFMSSVTFTTVGLPSGVTASFAPGSTTDSAVITLTVSNSASAGSTTFTVIGTSGSLSTSTVITLTTIAAPSLTLNGPASAPTLKAGSSTTATITVTGGGTFAGTVTLTAAVTSSPQGSQNPPQLSFGNTGSVMVASGTPGSANLTITTTGATTAALRDSREQESFKSLAGCSAIACMLLAGLCKRRGKKARFLPLGMLLVLVSSVLAGCSGGSPSSGSTSTAASAGTTAGNYVVTVTATSGTNTATVTVPLTVQ